MSEGHIKTIPPKVDVHEDEALSFSGRWGWLSSDVASADLEVYHGAEDVTSTLASGSPTITGKTVAYQRMSGWTGGEDYRALFQATDDGGNTHVREMDIHVVAKKTGR